MRRYEGVYAGVIVGLLVFVGVGGWSIRQTMKTQQDRIGRLEAWSISAEAPVSQREFQMLQFRVDAVEQMALLDDLQSFYQRLGDDFSKLRRETLKLKHRIQNR